MDVQLRVVLNSGQVIAGEIGSGAWGYSADPAATWAKLVHTAAADLGESLAEFVG